jgi:hypothetical protein
LGSLKLPAPTGKPGGRRLLPHLREAEGLIKSFWGHRDKVSLYLLNL